MTAEQAKEYLIPVMNYAAYREFDCSLYTSDRNRLFGEEHFKPEPNTAPAERPSPWQGEKFEDKMAELLGWGFELSDKAKFRHAVSVLSSGDHYLNSIVEKVKIR